MEKSSGLTGSCGAMGGSQAPTFGQAAVQNGCMGLGLLFGAQGQGSMHLEAADPGSHGSCSSGSGVGAGAQRVRGSSLTRTGLSGHQGSRGNRDWSWLR